MFSKEFSPTEDRGFLRFLEPGDIKGTILLTYDYADKDNDTWLFLPAMGRSRRISGGSRKNSFVNSDLTYEDMENVDLANNNFKLLKSEEYDGEPCYVVESTPADKKTAKESGYSKKVSWISQKTFLPRKVELYDKKERLAKVSKLDDIREIPGTEKLRPFRWEMENVLKRTKTILEYTEIKVDTGIPDSMFSQKMLK